MFRNQSYYKGLLTETCIITTVTKHASGAVVDPQTTYGATLCFRQICVIKQIESVEKSQFFYKHQAHLSL